MKILVVDDHPLIQEAAKTVLTQLASATEVIAATTCAEALRQVESHPDTNLILLDLGLPDVDGYEALAKLRRQHEAVPVVVLSANDSKQAVTKALEGGAMGFIPKTASTSVMINALRLVLSGAVYLPSEVLGPDAPSVAAGKDERPEPSATPADLGLTERQSQVLSLLIQGKPNKLIMRELGLAEATVKVHIGAILKALGVDNRTQAVIAVAQRGIKLGRLDAPRSAQFREP
jgi:DNA-binding NarL/FixJ family response regulator